MQPFGLFLRAVMALMFLLSALPVAAIPFCYVNPGHEDGTGNDWNHSMPLADALASTGCTQVWVAGGHAYFPGPAGHPEYSFVVRGGVKVYGGFFAVPGTEGDLSQRDPMHNPSVLSGDIDGDDVVDTNFTHDIVGNHHITESPYFRRGTNSKHVVVMDGNLEPITSETALDGFVITGGVARDDNGGGLWCAGVCSPTLSNLWFAGNAATYHGGAFFTAASADGIAQPVLHNVTMSGNSSVLAGSAIAISDWEAPDGTPSKLFASNSTFAFDLTDITRGDAAIWANGNSQVELVNVTLNENFIDYVTCRNCLWFPRIEGVPAEFTRVQDHGGTVPTILPPSDGLAIDAGDDSICSASPVNGIDQRGLARPQGAHCDLGAVEAHLASLNVALTGGGSVSATSPAAQYGSIASCTSAGGSACSATYAGEPAVVTLQASAPAGQVVTWGGACRSASSTATVALAFSDTGTDVTNCSAIFSTPTVWTVQSADEAPSLNSNDCTPAGSGGTCVTLRDALNRINSGDIIRFAPALDGTTITLSRFHNDQGCPADGPTQCAGAGTLTTAFGPSAFFISGKGVTIDAVTGLELGITLERDPAQPAFRLFDVDATAALDLRGVTLRNGLARGGSANASGGGALGAGGAIFS